MVASALPKSRRIGPSKLSTARAEKIVAEAAHLFATKGFGEASMRDLSKRVGIGMGTLYYHVPGGKVELLARIHEQSIGALRGQLADVLDVELDPREALRRTSAVIVEHIATYPDHLTVVFSELQRIRGRRFTQIINARNDLEHTIETLIERGIERGVLHTANPKLTTLGFMGMLIHTHVWYNPKERATPAEIGDFFAEMLLLGLEADGAHVPDRSGPRARQGFKQASPPSDAARPRKADSPTAPPARRRG